MKKRLQQHRASRPTPSLAKTASASSASVAMLDIRGNYNDNEVIMIKHELFRCKQKNRPGACSLTLGDDRYWNLSVGP